ncbi:MAG TPA: hypothetical protein VGX23_21745 [Actinocrinis sp.]|nr:hypothetical protein [Actinocrinis sp.]
MDDPALFPPHLTPFAEAHARELTALRNAPALHWAILVPPAGFGSLPEHDEAYRLLPEPVPLQHATARLSHALYARAVADELTRPTVHNARAAVIPLP